MRERHDVRALYDHNPDRVLGRTPKTLRLAEDSVGLRVEIDPPQSESNLLELLERGDVSQMSFGFVVRDERWEPGENGPDIRTVLDLDLFDVSVVTYPAYLQTDAAVRSHARWLQAHPDLRLWRMKLELERYRSRVASMR
jgi:HK97 family phage prohead protease